MHICLATNRMPSALLWNALVWVYSWTYVQYTLMECAGVECIHSCGIHYVESTHELQIFCLCIKLSVKWLFNICSQTILALVAYWFHNPCIAYLQFSIMYIWGIVAYIKDSTVRVINHLYFIVYWSMLIILSCYQIIIFSVTNTRSVNWVIAYPIQ